MAAERIGGAEAFATGVKSAEDSRARREAESTVAANILMTMYQTDAMMERERFRALSALQEKMLETSSLEKREAMQQEGATVREGIQQAGLTKREELSQSGQNQRETFKQYNENYRKMLDVDDNWRRSVLDNQTKVQVQGMQDTTEIYKANLKAQTDITTTRMQGGIRFATSMMTNGFDPNEALVGMAAVQAPSKESFGAVDSLRANPKTTRENAVAQSQIELNAANTNKANVAAQWDDMRGQMEYGLYNFKMYGNTDKMFQTMREEMFGGSDLHKTFSGATVADKNFERDLGNKIETYADMAARGTISSAELEMVYNSEILPAMQKSSYGRDQWKLFVDSAMSRAAHKSETMGSVSSLVTAIPGDVLTEKVMPAVAQDPDTRPLLEKVTSAVGLGGAYTAIERAGFNAGGGRTQLENDLDYNSAYYLTYRQVMGNMPDNATMENFAMLPPAKKVEVLQDMDERAKAAGIQDSPAGTTVQYFNSLDTSIKGAVFGFQGSGNYGMVGDAGATLLGGAAIKGVGKVFAGAIQYGRSWRISKAVANGTMTAAEGQVAQAGLKFGSKGLDKINLMNAERGANVGNLMSANIVRNTLTAMSKDIAVPGMKEGGISRAARGLFERHGWLNDLAASVGVKGAVKASDLAVDAAGKPILNKASQAAENFLNGGYPGAQATPDDIAKFVLQRPAGKGPAPYTAEEIGKGAEQYANYTIRSGVRASHLSKSKKGEFLTPDEMFTGMPEKPLPKNMVDAPQGPADIPPPSSAVKMPDATPLDNPFPVEVGGTGGRGLRMDGPDWGAPDIPRPTRASAAPPVTVQSDLRMGEYARNGSPIMKPLDMPAIDKALSEAMPSGSMQLPWTPNGSSRLPFIEPPSSPMQILYGAPDPRVPLGGWNLGGPPTLPGPNGRSNFQLLPSEAPEWMMPRL